jgi:hypothetical protein
MDWDSSEFSPRDTRMPLFRARASDCVVTSTDPSGAQLDFRFTCDWGIDGPELSTTAVARKHGLQVGSVFLMDELTQECLFANDGVFLVEADAHYSVCGSALEEPTGNHITLFSAAARAKSFAGDFVATTASVTSPTPLQRVSAALLQIACLCVFVSVRTTVICTRKPALPCVPLFHTLED